MDDDIFIRLILCPLALFSRRPPKSFCFASLMFFFLCLQEATSFSPHRHWPFSSNVAGGLNKLDDGYLSFFHRKASNFGCQLQYIAHLFKFVLLVLICYIIGDLDRFVFHKIVPPHHHCRHSLIRLLCLRLIQSRKCYIGPAESLSCARPCCTRSCTTTRAKRDIFNKQEFAVSKRDAREQKIGRRLRPESGTMDKTVPSAVWTVLSLKASSGCRLAPISFSQHDAFYHSRSRAG